MLWREKVVIFINQFIINIIIIGNKNNIMGRLQGRVIRE